MIFSLTLFLASTLPAANLTAADLAALVAQKSYAEVLARATEIAPASRDDTWRQHVLDAAMAEVARTDYLESFEADLRNRYAFVLEDLHYQQASSAPAMAAATECLSAAYGNTGHCRSMLEARRWSPTDAAMAAALVATHSNARNGVGLLAVAVEADAGQCKAERATEITLAALATPASGDRDRAVVIARACFETQKQALLDAFAADGGGGYLAEAICPLLLERKAVEGLQLRRCVAIGD